MSERVPTCEHGVYGDCSQCLRAENDQLREALRELVGLAEVSTEGDVFYAEQAGLDAEAILKRARRALGDTPDE
jgi:hypothetical protein